LLSLCKDIAQHIDTIKRNATGGRLCGNRRFLPILAILENSTIGKRGDEEKESGLQSLRPFDNMDILSIVMNGTERAITSITAIRGD